MCDLVAGQARHADVEHGRVGTDPGSDFQRLLPVAGDVHLVPLEQEDPGQTVRRVGVVVHATRSFIDAVPSAGCGLAAPERGPTGSLSDPDETAAGKRMMNSLPRPGPPLFA